MMPPSMEMKLNPFTIQCKAKAFFWRNYIEYKGNLMFGVVVTAHICKKSEPFLVWIEFKLQITFIYVCIQHEYAWGMLLPVSDVKII